jgi:hypothetical protein
MLDFSYYVEAVLEALGATTSLQKYRSWFPIPKALNQLLDKKTLIDRHYQCQVQYRDKLKELLVSEKEHDHIVGVIKDLANQH